MTRSFLSREADARFAQARIDAVRRIGELATAHQAAFIVVAGDVFESNQLSDQTLLRALDAFNALPVPIFLLPGNHDPLDAASIFQHPGFASSQRLVVLTDSEPRSVPGLEGVEIVGAPWPTKTPAPNPLMPVLAGLEPVIDRQRIVVAHGQTDALAPDPDKPDLIALAAVEEAVAEQRLHYLALGDRHSTQAVGATGRVWFSGAAVATRFVEDAPNQVLLVSLEPGSVEVEALTTGDWHFLTVDWHLSGAEDLSAALAEIEALPNKERTAVKVGVTGTIDLATAAALDDAFAQNADRFASFRRRDRTTDLAVVPGDLAELEMDLTGYAREAWQALSASSQSDPEAADALRLFYRLARSGGA